MATDTSSSSGSVAAPCGSRAPPTNARISTRPAGARCGHFDDSHERRQDAAGFAPRHHEAGSVQRVRDGVAGERQHDGRGRGVPDLVAQPGKPRVERAQQRAVTYAGVAATTDRGFERVAGRVDAVGARPVDAAPPSTGESRRTASAGSFATSAADHLAQTARAAIETRPGSAVERADRSFRNARSRLPCCRSASTNRGKSARMDRRSTSPA